MGRWASPACRSTRCAGSTAPPACPPGGPLDKTVSILSANGRPMAGPEKRSQEKRRKEKGSLALGVPACRSLPVLRTVRDRPALLVPVPLRCPPCRCAPSAPCFGGPAAAWVSCSSQGRSLAAGRTPPPPPGIISHPGEQSRVPAAPVWAPSVRCASSGHPHRQALDSTPGWDERRARRWRGKYAAWSVDSHNQWLQNRHSHQNTPKTRQKHAKKARKEKRWQNDGKTMA